MCGEDSYGSLWAVVVLPAMSGGATSHIGGAAESCCYKRLTSLLHRPPCGAANASGGATSMLLVL